jgi:hypothetical protein
MSAQAEALQNIARELRTLVGGGDSENQRHSPRAAHSNTMIVLPARKNNLETRVSVRDQFVKMS